MQIGGGYIVLGTQKSWSTNPLYATVHSGWFVDVTGESG